MRGEGKKESKSKLTLEDYIDITVDEADLRSYTLGQMNEIIAMHGFCKRKVKPEALKNLRALQMMSPSRSTVEEGGAAAFPCAELAVEEVKEDVRAIGWEECPIGSVAAVAVDTVEGRRPVSPAAGPSRCLKWMKTKKRTSRKQ